MDIGGIRDTYQELSYWGDGGSLTPPAGRGLGAPAMLYAGYLGHGYFDFADDMAQAARDGGNWYVPPGTFPADGSCGFIKFEGAKKLYNIYDGGNFLTGKAFGLIGMQLSLILAVADINSVLSRDGRDSSTDQQALKDGFNYMQVIWTT